MNAPEQPIAEEDLHAYVDNQLDLASRAVVARYLEQHPDVAVRVAAYAAQVQRLRQLTGQEARPLLRRVQ